MEWGRISMLSRITRSLSPLLLASLLWPTVQSSAAEEEAPASPTPPDAIAPPPDAPGKAPETKQPAAPVVPDEVQTIMDAHAAGLLAIDAEHHANLKQLTSGYLKALKRLRGEFQAAGDLEGMLTLDKAASMVDLENRSIGPKSKNPHIAKLQRIHHGEVRKAGLQRASEVARQFDKSDELLKDLEVRITKAGDLRTGVLVRAERDKLALAPANLSVRQALASAGVNSTGEKAAQGRIFITCNNGYQLFLNGKAIGQGSNWKAPQVYPVALKTGDVMTVYAWDRANGSRSAGLFCSVRIGGKEVPSADSRWRCSTDPGRNWLRGSALQNERLPSTRNVYAPHVNAKYRGWTGKFMWSSNTARRVVFKLVIP